ncbi:MAG TPA: hypothetical protein VFZ65_06790 [Planctomycetota bacterium]|nr:hypothetical protein [Planctomycetota bacterium]
MQRLTLALLSLVSAGCGGDPGAASPAVRHIAGGKAVQFQGVTFDIPSNWSSQAGQGGMLLTPEGANPSGMVEEMYLLGGDPAVRSFAGDDAERSIQQSVEQIQPGASKTSGPEPAKFGALDGRKWTWSATSQDGRQVEVRVFAFLGNQGCALFALGYPDVLARRAHDVDAMLASLAKTAPAAARGGGGVAEELVGQWIWMSNFSANNGGGSQTNTWIMLQADGRYQWHHDSVSTNPNGAAWGSQDETGSWSAAGDSITFRPDRGEPYTQGLEKRNHPKNVNDPMIVLDGKAYVTATNRRPW